MGTEPDDEWLMMDASHVTVHPHASGAKGETKIGPAQKGAPFQEPFGRGCAWVAGPNYYYRRYPIRLYTGSRLNPGISAGH